MKGTDWGGEGETRPDAWHRASLGQVLLEVDGGENRLDFRQIGSRGP